jgi:hypothetical protein
MSGQSLIDLEMKFVKLLEHCTANPQEITDADRHELHRLRICKSMPYGDQFYRTLQRGDELRGLV